MPDENSSRHYLITHANNFEANAEDNQTNLQQSSLSLLRSGQNLPNLKTLQSNTPSKQQQDLKRLKERLAQRSKLSSPKKVYRNH